MRTLTLLVILLPAPALAQSADEPEEAPRAVRYAEITEIDMADLEMTATRHRPEGSIVIARKQAVFPPLVDLRVDFDTELAESVRLIK